MVARKNCLSLLKRLSWTLAVLVPSGIFPSPAYTDIGSLEGSLSKGFYTSPSERFTCQIDDLLKKPALFIDDASVVSEADSLTFGFDDGNQFLIWSIRSQKIGRLEKGPIDTEGFPITQESYIPHFYSELPYAISGLGPVVTDGSDGSRTGYLLVELEQKGQRHAYWTQTKNGWLNSIQFLPPLSVHAGNKLTLRKVKQELNAVLNRCIFLP